ncbi:MAG TPA: alpha-amylase family glycosyl hydrolase, partial [Mariniphaga sp.]|nr:alpha-amylase family glycosyl hydrolase [Mariniphaga sp.]
MKYRTIFPKFINKSTCQFNTWASKPEILHLIIDGHPQPYEMSKEDYGFWSVQVENLSPGSRYKYQIDGKESYPDPASLSQPEGVHDASEVIDLDDFEWTDSGWDNIAPDELIIYELHTGTFSDEGTFKGIRTKIKYLKELGINAIELLPVAQFSGYRNWGYDGVYPFAVQNSYGGAKELMALVNDCHNNGIAVILDVVYNHFGPEGNYSGQFSHFFTDHYPTPWGQAINFDSEFSDGVRNYFIQNALMWCRNFHIDGLRLDAVHAIYDFGVRHFLRELSDKIEELSNETGRKCYLIAESHLNDVKYISPAAKGGFGLDSQWSDD